MILVYAYDTEGRTIDFYVAEDYKWRLEMLSHEMLALQTSNDLDQYESNSLECLLKSYSIITKVASRETQVVSVMPTKCF